MSVKTTVMANGSLPVLLVTPWFTVSLSTVVPYISLAGINTSRGSPERADKTSSAFTEDTSLPKSTLVIDLACLTPSTGRKLAKKIQSISRNYLCVRAQ